MGREIERRDHYEDLTAKMRAIVDARAEHPDASSAQIAEYASRTLPDGESVSESYVRVVLRKQSHIVDEREEQVLNRREEGEMRTAIDGDPFEALGSESDAWQSIVDRPVKSTGGNGGVTIHVEGELTEKEVRQALTGTIPDRLYDDILEEMVHAAFRGDARAATG